MFQKQERTIAEGCPGAPETTAHPGQAFLSSNGNKHSLFWVLAQAPDSSPFLVPVGSDMYPVKFPALKNFFGTTTTTNANITR